MKNLVEIDVAGDRNLTPLDVQAYDQLIPALKNALAFIGLTDVEIIRLEVTNDSAARLLAIAKAYSAVD